MFISLYPLVAAGFRKYKIEQGKLFPYSPCRGRAASAAYSVPPPLYIKRTKIPFGIWFLLKLLFISSSYPMYCPEMKTSVFSRPFLYCTASFTASRNCFTIPEGLGEWSSPKGIL